MGTAACKSYGCKSQYVGNELTQEGPAFPVLYWMCEKGCNSTQKQQGCSVSARRPLLGIVRITSVGPILDFHFEMNLKL